ncbi:STAS domain-containing protein [Bradyrhizobium japonicum]|uniref:STAS domain-containing protein n=1 Tax=Bradyrhizobium japonicum TaxID=375 RepID=UPI001BA8E94E|nr:STAS domain-containing protein [Bradyrhizobium japonicum]MBR0993088.1 STAS domain-containing protein [Bradyrhizobium japonicum]
MEFRFGNDGVQISGEFTFTDHASFKSMIDRLLLDGSSSVTMDLGQLQFIDSAGLGMLLLARDAFGKADRKLVLRAPSGQVKRMFGLTKFDTLFSVED